MHYQFKVILLRPEIGYDYLDFDIYAHNNQSAFNKLFKELGDLRKCLCGVFINSDFSDSEIFELR